MCHMSGVTCDMSGVRCQVFHFWCQMSLFSSSFFIEKKMVELDGGRSVIIGAYMQRCTVGQSIAID